MEKKIPPLDVWASAIGCFMLNFGTVEYHTFAFLEKELPPEEFQRLKKLHLQDRLGRIAKYMKEKDFPVSEQEAFDRLVQDIAPVRDLRNLLAHGHLYGRFDPESLSFTVVVSPAKDLDEAHLPTTRSAEFEEIRSALNTLQQLLEPLSRLAGFVPGPDHQL